MNVSAWPVLTWLVFFPLAACLVLPLIRGEKAVRVFTLLAGLAEPYAEPWKNVNSSIKSV